MVKPNAKWCNMPLFNFKANPDNFYNDDFDLFSTNSLEQGIVYNKPPLQRTHFPSLLAVRYITFPL